MEFEGQIKDIQIDWKTNQPNIIIQADAVRLADLEYYTYQKLQIKIDIFRKKRSKDANAYAWVLMSKIAEATMTDKWDVYLQALKRYSNSFVTVEVLASAIPMLRHEWRAVVDLGESKEDYHQVQLYFGSHTFNAYEMSIFIDGLISEAKNLGIETLRPVDLESMKRAWGKNHP